jgi:hypothetical protein
MAIEQLVQTTPELLKLHRERIDVCRGFACLTEFKRVFGTTESNELERIIDGKTARRNEDGEAQWSRKYVRYTKGSAPDDKTLKAAIKAADQAKRRKPRTGFWRDNLLWELAQEPPPSLERLSEIMVMLPHGIRRQLYHFSIPENHGRQFHRQDFKREHALHLRKRATLASFIALLALAREGEIREDDSQHGLSVRCAFEIFPIILIDNPQLAARWWDLFHVLKLAFWSRRYYGGIYFDDLTPTNTALGLVAKSRDRHAELPWDARIIGAGMQYVPRKPFVLRAVHEQQDGSIPEKS